MYKALFVDDEILVRRNISEIVKWEEAGFELAGVCENGKQALDFLKREPVDLVVTDIDMPYMDGLELSQHLYEDYPRTTIVILSGYNKFDYAKQAIRYEVTEYILKPVTAREFMSVLKNVKEKLDKEKESEQRMNQLVQGYNNYTKNESLIISKTLSRLMKGTQDMGSLQEELNNFNIHISGKAYRIIVVNIDLFSDMYGLESEKRKESALISFAIENIANKIVNRDETGIAFRDTDNRICILAKTNKIVCFREEIRRICREIQKEVYRSMTLTVSIGIGAYVYSLDGLYSSYESAVNILKYCYTKGSGALLDGETIVEDAHYSEFESVLRELKYAVKNDDCELVEKILEEFEQYISTAYVSRNRVVTYLLQMLRCVYDGFYELELDITWDDSRVSRITESGSFAEAMRLTKEYIWDGMNYCKEAFRSSNEKLAMKAEDYLRQNYDNPELNLNMICQYLNISVSYFSSIFKEITGKTFKEMLIQLRIEKAKQLLKQGDMKNYEIAVKVGFTDPHYFTILFKKMTGKTPKEYAKEMRE